MSLILVLLTSAVLIAAFFGTPKDGNGVKPALSAYTLVLSLFAVYAVFPAVLILANDSKYLWAPSFSENPALPVTLGLCLVALFAFLLGHFVFSRRSNHNPFEWASKVKDHTPVSLKGVRTAIVLVLIGLGLKIYFVLSSGGLNETVQRLSGSIRTNSGLDQLDANAVGLRTVSGVADGAAVWLVLLALKSKRHRTLAFAALLFVLALSYTTMGKRLGLLWPLLAVVIGIHLFVKKVGIRALPIGVIAFLALTMGTLFFRIFLPAASAGVGIDLNTVSYSGGSILAFYFYSLEFSTVEMMTVAIYGRQEINDLFGGPVQAFWETSIVPFTYVIPRTIWPDKPENIYDLSHGISAVSTGTPLQSVVGYASTLVGTSYITAGIAGTIVAFLALGWLTARVDRNIMRTDWSVNTVLRYSFLLVVVFHLFRQGTIGWVFIIAVVQQLGFLAGIVLPSMIAAGGTNSSSAGKLSPRLQGVKID
ncbi:O-antigen polymerase [Arthrobacter sp. NPDC080073]|uniref:O-antigen polymerase n=1 Tax=Arthrobacter sp. NPDC080073 TaxID=3155919 RepID=UPI00342D63CE